MKSIKIVAAAALVSLAALSNAHAGGFLADTFIKPFSPELARTADRFNHQMGNPVDHGIAAGVDVFVPGAGRALEAGWAIQRSGVLNPPQFAPPQVMQQQPMGQQMSVQQPSFGNFCLTPAGRFGPGPVNPLGSSCHANTPFGVVFGVVGQ